MKQEKSHFDKIRLEPLDLPSVQRIGDGSTYAPIVWRIHYGVSRGWATYPDKASADAELAKFVASQIHSTARKIDALCKLQRRLSDGAA